MALVNQRVKTWHFVCHDGNISSTVHLLDCSSPRRFLSMRLDVDDAPLMEDFDIKKLAVPGVCLLVSLLAYSSQVLFLYLDPCPLTQAELLMFNSLVLCIWICYLRACRTSPGKVPSEWTPQISSEGERQEKVSEIGIARSRWCRKCEVMKPPRAHHCKACGRLVSLTYFDDLH